MSKKQKRPEENIIKQNISDTLELNYMPYAMAVIVSRAIPEIDGFKPAHRKLLYTMYLMGLLKGNRIKSADVVGQTMKLNPHGDSAIYETLVRLTRGNDALLHPFVDSKGNFGKHYSRDMAYAASRYTEVKLSSFCEEIFRDIDKNVVDFMDNYNGTTKEPTLFPTTFPNVLVTPNQGIAVAMASSICSFNLNEVCAATEAYIKNPNVDLSKYLLGPDFSTGGELIQDAEEAAKVYETGRGGFTLRAKYRYDKKNNCIEVYEIPYTTTIEFIIDKVVALVKAGKLREINDIRDETDLHGLKIAIDIKRNVRPELLMQRLFSMTSLSDRFSANFNILIEGKPRTMGVREILREWVIFRAGCLRRQIAFDIEKKNERLNLLEGLSKILLDIDRAIAIIRKTEEDSRVIPNLMEGFDINREQAEFIAEIRLRNLNKEYLLNKVNERDKLIKELEELNSYLENEGKIKTLICRQLRDVAKKYGQERRTEIVVQEELLEIDEEEFIEDYGLKLFLTEQNYLKKISLASLRSASEQKVKDGDRIIQELETGNKADLILFSNKCSAFKSKLYDIPDCKASSMGEYLNNLFDMEPDERIIFLMPTKDYEGSLLFAFANGKIAKVSLSSYATKTNRKKLVNAYSGKSELVAIYWLPEDKDFVAIRDMDKAALFNTSLLSVNASKNATGVQVCTLRKKNKMTRLYPAEEFISHDLEYYRINKIPSAGHFITEKDKVENQLGGQISLA